MKQKSIMTFIKSTSAKGIIGILLFALVVTSSMYGIVNRIVNYIIPERNVEIITYDDYSIDDLIVFSLGGVGDVSDSVNEAIYKSHNYDREYISLKVKPSIFFAVDQDYFVPFSVRSYSDYYEYLEPTEDEYIKVFPFKNSTEQLLIQFVVYGVLYCAIAVCMLLINGFLSSSAKKDGLLFRRYKLNSFWIIWAFLYVFSIIRYNIGIENYLIIGDEEHYWNVSLFNNGRFATEYLAGVIPTFRGYLCYLLPTISHYFEDVTSIDGVYFYLIFSTLCFAWLSGVVAPCSYELLCKKNANYIQVIAFLFVYALIWQDYIFTICVDNFGAVAFISFLYYLAKGYKSNNRLYYLLAGIFIAVSILFRLAYLYCVYVIIVFVILALIKERKLTFAYFKDNILSFLENGIALVVPIIIISLPQLVINNYRGVFSLLPYDCDTAWFGYSLLQQSANWSLRSGMILYPRWVADSQMLGLKKLLYNDNDSVLSLAQIMDVYANSPIESLICIFKKLFEIFDKKTTSAYTPIDFRGQWPVILGLINYSIQYCALYTFFKRGNKKIWILGGVLLAGIVLPQMFVHVEWRYVYAAYLFLFFIFAYIFIGEIVTNREEYRTISNGTFYIWLALYVFLSTCLSFSLWA